MDIGCGTLRGGIPTIQYLNKGYYYGMDVRDEVLHKFIEKLLYLPKDQKEAIRKAATERIKTNFNIAKQQKEFSDF